MSNKNHISSLRVTTESL